MGQGISDSDFQNAQRLVREKNINVPVTREGTSILVTLPTGEKHTFDSYGAFQSYITGLDTSSWPKMEKGSLSGS